MAKKGITREIRELGLWHHQVKTKERVRETVEEAEEEVHQEEEVEEH